MLKITINELSDLKKTSISHTPSLTEHLERGMESNKELNDGSQGHEMLSSRHNKDIAVKNSQRGWLPVHNTHKILPANIPSWM